MTLCTLLFAHRFRLRLWHRLRQRVSVAPFLPRLAHQTLSACVPREHLSRHQTVDAATIVTSVPSHAAPTSTCQCINSVSVRQNHCHPCSQLPTVPIPSLCLRVGAHGCHATTLNCDVTSTTVKHTTSACSRLHGASPTLPMCKMLSTVPILARQTFERIEAFKRTKTHTFALRAASSSSEAPLLLGSSARVVPWRARDICDWRRLPSLRERFSEARRTSRAACNLSFSAGE